MKIYKISLCLIFALFATTLDAQQKKNDGFVLNGHLDGIENNVVVYLVDIDGQKTIEYAKIFNGTFRLKGKVGEPTACWLQCKDKYTNLMVENTEMTYSSSYENMQLYAKVKGGREQQLQNELIALQLPYEKLYLEASDSLRNDLYADKKTKEALIKKNNDNGEASQRIYIKFGKENYNSFLGLDIIYRNRETIGKDSIKMLYDKLNSDLKKTVKAEALKVFSTEILAQVGEYFIDFEAKTINGDTFKLSSLKGKYIFLSFGSAGCVPCRWENKQISKNYEKFKDKIYFVSFSIDKNREAWLEVSKKDNITWTNVSDLKGEGSKTKNLYNVQAIPTSFLIDKNGIIIEKFDGYNDDFLNKIENKLN